MINIYNGLGHYGIAEIKLDPNNAPTGQPEIKGNLVIGEYIIRRPFQYQ